MILVAPHPAPLQLEDLFDQPLQRLHRIAPLLVLSTFRPRAKGAGQENPSLPEANFERLLDREQGAVLRFRRAIRPLYSYFDDSLFNQEWPLRTTTRLATEA
jgi:hypothetical protein